MTDKLEQWLQALDLVKYGDVFVQNEISFSDLAHLTENDLKELGLPIGPRRRAMRAIASIAAMALLEDPGVSVGTDTPSGPSAERRQLTVMFCDLVGSTALSEKLDPEDLRMLMRRYQNAVSGCVARYGGHIAKFLGDGVLVYFGWPLAYEDQAERAGRAALDAIEAVHELLLENGESLNARAGIATGLVVVGELEGDDARDVDAVAGSTPNLAARLQEVAQPGHVVLADETYQLIRGIFRTENLGRCRLKGFAEAVTAWRLIGESEAAVRFEAIHGAQLHRLVGRDSELSMLSDRWRLACEGEGQVVLISGEPGLGKSRLVEALREAVGDSDVTRLRYQCSAYHVNTALYSVIRQLERAAGFRVGDSEEVKLDKLEHLLVQRDHFVAFADLLSLPLPVQYDSEELTPDQRKERILRAIAGELLDLARTQPVLVLFEDAHWIDPTTQELLDSIASHIADAAILMVVTHRPEWQATFVNVPHATMLTLNRLGRRQAGDIVREIANGPLSDELVSRIVEKADGVPLFIEELTKVVTEDGSSFGDLDIPATLQASLLARLDRLAVSAKETAQIGSVIGREFDYQLLSKITVDSELDLGTALDQLAASELVFRHGTGERARYTFKHALIQDAAYESLLRERRRQLHGQIADALSLDIEESPQTALANRAVHLSRAERHREAAEAWCVAGEGAARVFALKEALSDFANGIECLGGVAAGSDRDRLELRLRRGLSMPSMMLEGITAKSVEQNLLKASTLSHELNSNSDTVRTGWGLFHIYENMGRWGEACTHADEIWTLSNETGDEDLVYQARHAQWSYRGLVGDFVNALQYASTGWQRYEHNRHHAQAYEFGWHDPKCCAGNYIAWSCSNLGFADQAARQIAENVAFNDELKHPMSAAICKAFAAMSHIAIRRFDEAKRHASAAKAIADEYDIRAIGGMSLMFLSRVRLAEGEAQQAAEEMERILARRRQNDRPGLFLPMHLGFLAEAYLELGRVDDGLAAVADAKRFARMENEMAWWPEVLRVEALLNVDGGSRSFDKATELLRKAMKYAEAKSVRTQQLRCTIALARLLDERGNRFDAQAILAAVYDQFSEGFDTPDLIEARELLDQLA